MASGFDAQLIKHRCRCHPLLSRRSGRGSRADGQRFVEDILAASLQEPCHGEVGLHLQLVAQIGMSKHELQLLPRGSDASCGRRLRRQAVGHRPHKFLPIGVFVDDDRHRHLVVGGVAEGHLDIVQLLLLALG